MIISHSRKFIFVKTYKTAGSSLEIALSKYCARGDILTPLDADEELQRRALTGLGAQNYGKPARRYRIEDVAPAPEPAQAGRAIQRAFRRLANPPDDRPRDLGALLHLHHRAQSLRPLPQPLLLFQEGLRGPGREKAWDFGNIDQYMRYNPWFINENWAMYTQADEVLVDFFVRYEHLEADSPRSARASAWSAMSTRT